VKVRQVSLSFDGFYIDGEPYGVLYGDEEPPEFEADALRIKVPLVSSKEQLEDVIYCMRWLKRKWKK